jgi:hypothetical protein
MPLLLKAKRGQREAPLMVLARLKPIDAVVGEELGPQIPVAGIDGAGVVRIELVQRQPVFEAQVRRHAQASITSRQ